MPTVSETSKTAEWRSTILTELIAGKHLEFNSMSDYFRDFSSRHPDFVTAGSASTYYYVAKRNGGLDSVQEHHAARTATKTEDKTTSEPSVQVAETISRTEINRLERLMTERTSNRPDPEYVVGQTVRVMVTRVETYGALVETLDGYKTPGLIHKSNIAYVFVTDPGHYFTFTDELEVEIVKVEPDGRLGMSTKGFGLKPKYQHKAPVVPNATPVKATIQPVTTLGENAAQEKAAPVAAVIPITSDDMREVYSYLNGIVGAVTPAAQDAFITLIEKFGMFRFTKALTKAETGFQKDLGVALARHLESSLSQSL